MEYYGYAGKVLHVDLSSGDIKVEPLDLDLATGFIGGAGIGYRLAYDLIKPGIHPLSPENAIIIGMGPLVGTITPAASKTTAVMKFPVSASKREKKYFIDVSVGGSFRFGAMLKYAGYDHVVITGRAKKPCYLKIIDDDIEICDASDLWGKADPYQTTDYLANKYKGSTGKAGVVAIGKAGENLIEKSVGLVDNISSFFNHGAAVPGSKNLKAIVSLGAKGIKVADRRRLMSLVDKMRKKIMTHPNFMAGRNAAFVRASEAGYPEDVCDRGLVARVACISCPDPCKSNYVIRDGRFKGEYMRDARPQHLVRWGSRMKLKDYGEMLKLFDMINIAGVSNPSAVRMLHFVTRMFERGVISTKETGGLVLKTGDFDTYVKLLEKWVNREDIGEYMAQGWYALSEKVGVDASADFIDGCSIVRGCDNIEDARRETFNAGFGMGGIVRPRGQHNGQGTNRPRGQDLHKDTYFPAYPMSLNDVRKDSEKLGMSAEDIDRIFTEEDFNIGRLEKHAEDCLGVLNSVGMCWSGGRNGGQPVADVRWIAEVYSAVTGLGLTTEELKIKGERVNTLGKLLMIREGFTRADEEVPEVWLQNIETPFKVWLPDTEPPFKLVGQDRYLVDWFGRRLTREAVYRMLDDYYDERGCDIKKGIPGKEKLTELGLEQFADIIKPYL